MATIVFHDGDHPLWKVAGRSVIPQPGAFAHFHWLGPPEIASGLVEGDTFEGYFLELKAVKTFYFEHGGDTILVEPAIDLRTHVNVVASFPE